MSVVRFLFVSIALYFVLQTRVTHAGNVPDNSSSSIRSTITKGALYAGKKILGLFDAPFKFLHRLFTGPRKRVSNIENTRRSLPTKNNDEVLDTPMQSSSPVPPITEDIRNTLKPSFQDANSIEKTLTSLAADKTDKMRHTTTQLTSGKSDSINVTPTRSTTDNTNKINNTPSSLADNIVITPTKSKSAVAAITEKIKNTLTSSFQDANSIEKTLTSLAAGKTDKMKHTKTQLTSGKSDSINVTPTRSTADNTNKINNTPSSLADNIVITPTKSKSAVAAVIENIKNTLTSSFQDANSIEKTLTSLAADKTDKIKHTTTQLTSAKSDSINVTPTRSTADNTNKIKNTPSQSKTVTAAFTDNIKNTLTSSFQDAASNIDSSTLTPSIPVITNSIQNNRTQSLGDATVKIKNTPPVQDTTNTLQKSQTKPLKDAFSNNKNIPTPSISDDTKRKKPMVQWPFIGF